jgi:hypothetical protein
MKPEELGGRSAVARPQSWMIVLPKPGQHGAELRPETMNASELMFFFGAPLAHVVAYEEHERVSRQERAVRGFARSHRALDLSKQAELV